MPVLAAADKGLQQPPIRYACGSLRMTSNPVANARSSWADRDRVEKCALGIREAGYENIGFPDAPMIDYRMKLRQMQQYYRDDHKFSDSCSDHTGRTFREALPTAL